MTHDQAKKVPVLVTVSLVLAVALAGCQGLLIAPQSDSARSEGRTGEPNEPATATATHTPRPAKIPSATPTASATPATELDPTLVEPALNPLTGLPVAEPEGLCTPPLLVSISNFPASARPQSGLSAASNVWEIFIGEGMTRFLAVFYGDYRIQLQQILDNRLADGEAGRFVIGPVRSGRVVFEDIKSLFPRAILITAGASQEVVQQLTNRDSVYAQDPDDINSAGLGPDQLPAGECTVAPDMYGDLTFSQQPPAGGLELDFVRIVYNLFNQVGWQYDAERGAYLRFQDQADGSGDLEPALEALTGEQLAFDNVLVLWAQHRFVTPTIIEMELVYVRDRYGLLLRDGKVYEVRWSTPGGRLEIHDAAGEPLPLNPGSTFFEVVSYQSTWNAEEAIIRYHNPPLQP